MHCPHCGQEHPDEIIFCPVTGIKLVTPSYCMVCGIKLEANWKVCPKCGSLKGEAIQPGLTGEQKKKGLHVYRQLPAELRKTALYGILLFLPIVIIIVGSYLVFMRPFDYLSPNLDETGFPEQIPVQLSPTDTPFPEPTETSLPLPTFSPLLYDEEFPGDLIDYPQDWPVDLHYPEPFQLVEAQSGGPTGETIKGWEAKLRYPGGIQDAANLLAEFFVTRGWQVEERMEAGDSGLILFVVRDERRNTGVITLAPSTKNPGQTHIIAIIFQ